MSPNKTQQVLDLKQRCTDRSVCDIKVQRERLDSIFKSYVLMSNKSFCFAFLLKQCVDVVTATVVLLGFKSGLIFFPFLITLYLQDFTVHSVQMWINGYT